MATLLDDLRRAGHDIAGITFRLDALHTQHATATLLHDAGAGYVMTVKGNQPSLLAVITEQLRTDEPSAPPPATAATAGPRNDTYTSWTRPPRPNNGGTVHVLIDFAHVLEYLWRAAWSFHFEGDRTPRPGYTTNRWPC